jgi:DNA-binding transcriptional MerR regulator
MSSQAELPGIRAAAKARKLAPDQPIPDKLYFKIGEVSQLVGVRAHVLRYWEKEVPSIRPGKSASNQRRYRYRDVEIFREIRRLLHQERYTLAGAKKRIMAGEKGEPLPAPEAADFAPPVTASAMADDDDTIVDNGTMAAFAASLPMERLERVRAGLRELIAMAGETP